MCKQVICGLHVRSNTKEGLSGAHPLGAKEVVRVKPKGDGLNRCCRAPICFNWIVNGTCSGEARDTGKEMHVRVSRDVYADEKLPVVERVI